MADKPEGKVVLVAGGARAPERAVTLRFLEDSFVTIVPLHRKAMTRAISSGLGHLVKSALGMALGFASASMMLGSTEFTPTPVPFPVTPS